MNTQFTTREEYLAFAAEWKLTYANLSHLIRWYRRKEYNLPEGTREQLEKVELDGRKILPTWDYSALATQLIEYRWASKERSGLQRAASLQLTAS